MSFWKRKWVRAESGGRESGLGGVGLGLVEVVTAYNSASLRLRERMVFLHQISAQRLGQKLQKEYFECRMRVTS